MRAAVLDDYQGGAARWADWASLEPEVQVELLHVPIGEDQLAQTLEPFEVIVAMRERTAALINTSRGPIIEEAALIASLREGTIAGASEAGVRHMYSEVVEDIAAHLAGAPIRLIATG